MTKHKNIKVNVACLPNEEKQIKKLFFDCLEDYTKRFNVQVTEKKMLVNICLVEYDEEARSQGLTTYADGENKILIQVRDPLLNEWEPNHFTMDKFINILCHEIIHACQYLCNREGIKIRNLKYNKKDECEAYFFDPSEMEARLLEAPYTAMYGSNL